MRDSRFLPVKLSEVTALQCSTSLLHSFQAADSWDDWEVGQHGTTIDFKNPYSGRHHSATFLPEVAHSQQWDKKETLTHLINKAGCRVTDPDDLRMILASKLEFREGTNGAWANTVGFDKAVPNRVRMEPDLYGFGYGFCMGFFEIV